MLNKLRALFANTLHIANLDGGTVIAISVANFLSGYLLFQYARLYSSPMLLLLCSVVLLVNSSAITVRILALTQGNKLSLPLCYLHALQRLPQAFGFSALVSSPIAALTIFAILSQNLGLLTLANSLSLYLIPFCTGAYVYLVGFRKGPLQAISSLVASLRHPDKLRITLFLCLLYNLPFALQAKGNVLAVLSNVWFLFCFLLTIMLHSDYKKPKQTKAHDNSVIIKL